MRDALTAILELAARDDPHAEDKMDRAGDAIQRFVDRFP